MAHRTDAAKGREILSRWCALAEARLEHLTELFETGRWRRYYSEAAFLENIREAKAAVETWRNLSRREASLDNSPIDISWLGRSHATPLPDARLWPQPQPIERRARRPVQGPPATAKIERWIGQLSAAEDAQAQAQTPLPLLDLAAMQARYPLLRNTL
jgi:uncharacterized repeat protein (TIGR03809 family)